MYHIGRNEHNPFLEGLSQKALLNRKKNDTLGTFNISKNSIVVNWGLAKQFKCKRTNIKEVRIQFFHKEKKLERMVMRQFEEMYFELANENHLECYPWNLYSLKSLNLDVNGMKSGAQDDVI